MAILTHDDLNALIWGGGPRKSVDEELDKYFQELYRVWFGRFVLWLVKAWLDESWSNNPTKAMGVLLFLYVLSFVLNQRDRHALNVRLLVLLSAVGMISDIIRPLISLGTITMSIFDIVLTIASIILAIFMLKANARIMMRLLRRPRASRVQKKKA